MLESLKIIIYILIKSQLLVFLVILISFIVENLTSLKLFIDHFLWEKSPKNAEIGADGTTGYYFIFCTSVFGYHIYKGYLEFTFFNIIVWLLVIAPLTGYFRKTYDKYQKIDPNKPDDELF